MGAVRFAAARGFDGTWHLLREGARSWLYWPGNSAPKLSPAWTAATGHGALTWLVPIRWYAVSLLDPKLPGSLDPGAYRRREGFRRASGIGTVLRAVSAIRSVPAARRCPHVEENGS
jgi:hypothetical protein